MILSWLDIGLAIVMLISGYLAMLRGLTREVLAILSWGVAAFATMLLWPQYRDDVRGYISPDILADIVLAAGIFILVLIVVSLLTVYIADKVLDSRIGALDRTLGVVFGLARGLILVVILYLFLNMVVPKETQPIWVQQARSLPLIEQTGEVIREIGESIVTMFEENLDSVIPDTGDDPNKQSSNGRLGTGLAQNGRAGYQSGERRGLEQLLESTTAARN